MRFVARRRIAATVLRMLLVLLICRPALGFGIYGGVGMERGARWDVAPRTNGNGLERSLSGGLRFSLTGGSYQALRDSYSWAGTPPTMADFQQAVLDAFNAWTIPDPATGLTSSLSFVPDFGTAVTIGTTTGAEIDVMAVDLGDAGTRGVANLSWAGFENVRLTSGVDYYGQPINGGDIRINSNPGANYTLPLFRLLLSHEIGHTLGLQDVDISAGPDGIFIDDNYDGTSNASAAATLTNSFANLIDPYNPGGSPLQFYTIPNGSPGFDSSGATIMMESNLPGSLIGNLTPLRNDDYAGRQFLYPAAPVLPGTELPLVAQGSVWRYLDNGSNQGQAWRTDSFNDSTWRSGPAELGYADGPATPITFIDADPVAAGVQKNATSYFRHTFDFAGDPATVSHLLLDLLRDDGAIVYLNGVEIRRDTLPPGAAFDAYTNEAVAGEGETTFYRSLVTLSRFPVGTLRNGPNLLAVEIHQSDPDSSDVSFNLRLTAIQVPEPATWLLAAMGLAGIAIYRRRRTKSASV
jgi:hypothetical protein